MRPHACCSRRTAASPTPNHLRFRLGHDDGVTLRMEAKEPGEHLTSQGVDLRMDFRHVLCARRGAYERLLGDALDGNPARFARQDGVEAAWRIVQPLIDAPGLVDTYPRGSWGPPAGDAIADVAGDWHAPDVPPEAGRSLPAGTRPRPATASRPVDDDRWFCWSSPSPACSLW